MSTLLPEFRYSAITSSGNTDCACAIFTVENDEVVEPRPKKKSARDGWQVCLNITNKQDEGMDCPTGNRRDH